MSFFHTDMTQVVEIRPRVKQHILSSKYNWYWCSGPLRRQGIINYYIDHIEPV